MLKIPVIKGNINRALKLFKRKFKKTSPPPKLSTAQIRRLTVDGKAVTDAPFVPDARKGKFKNIEIGMKDMPAGYNEGGKVIGKKKVIIGPNSNLTDEELDRYIAQLRGEIKPVKKNKGGAIKGFSPIARPQRFKGVF